MYRSLERYSEAVCDLTAVLYIEPNNKKVRLEMEELKKFLIPSPGKKESTLPSLGSAASEEQDTKLKAIATAGMHNVSQHLSLYIMCVIKSMLSNFS